MRSNAQGGADGNNGQTINLRWLCLSTSLFNIYIFCALVFKFCFTRWKAVPITLIEQLFVEIQLPVFNCSSCVKSLHIVSSVSL